MSSCILFHNVSHSPSAMYVIRSYMRRLISETAAPKNIYGVIRRQANGHDCQLSPIFNAPESSRAFFSKTMASFLPLLGRWKFEAINGNTLVLVIVKNNKPVTKKAIDKRH
ncbi:unnamed protein product [Fusarium graminearum]|uniref:Uncharacterized protein n=1 Tax=Gibberella zeae TaxID=5518 RepID=A0A4E9E4G0_GIBZA|nr:unnamed protein product [Fusarium graminearum]CAF3600981.1 unnamed protein product [Fusarium graminearum]CAG1966659.1 unnamed protein product [Fusarium graminearum]CAG1978623.1 unnamed protein product [Fusarium graminearum]